MPTVSVVLPTFDRARLIGRALTSIADQTYANIEIVVIDDGSTDDTREVVDRFARQSSRPVTYLRQENSGCAAARNRGLQVAKGEFLTFLDSDDAWLPTAAESLANTLVASEADFVYSPAIEAFPDGTERVNYPVAADRPEVFAVEHFKETNIRNGAFMLRRHVLSTVAGLDESLRHNEDSDFIQRIAIHYKAAYCSSPTVKVYHHDENKSLNRVGIYGALSKSAERVLVENPTFKNELGEMASRRMRELKTKHVEALLIAGEFEEARNVAASSKEELTRVVRLASRMRSTTPMKIRNRLVSLRRVPRRTLRYLIRGGRSRVQSRQQYS
jgi:glycosyltransferase involved in cell wall biosynthesis